MRSAANASLSQRLTHVFEKGSAGEEDIDVFIIDPPIQERKQKKESLLIRKVDPPWEKGSSLNMVCSSFFYVHVDDPVEQIVEELSMLDNVLALGVTDQQGEALGVIVRQELFDLMGRSYGQSFIAKRRARSVMKHVKTFSADSHIFSVAASIEEDINGSLINYFLIKDKYQRFAGIFSSKDMMLFYSRTLNREMKQVQDIQRSIVEPEITYQSEQNYVHGVSLPSREAGGDYYCVRKMEGDKLFYCVADVSGKGYPASLITSILGSQLENTTFSSGLDGSLKKLNTYLNKKFVHMGIFVTGLFILLDTKKNHALVCDCGHQYFYLLRERSLKKVNGPVNPPLGLIEDMKLEMKTLKIQKDDTLLLMTDGLVEQTNKQGEEYPLTRLIKALLTNPDQPNGQDVLDDLLKFRGFSHQHDDMTLLVHRRMN